MEVIRARMEKRRSESVEIGSPDAFVEGLKRRREAFVEGEAEAEAEPQRQQQQQQRCAVDKSWSSRKKRPTKRGCGPRRSVTYSMESPAEQLWSAKTRGILDFEPIEPIKDVMPVGGVGVVAGPSGGNGRFEAYLKQPVVVERLEAEGFEPAGPGAPHRWFLVRKPGVATPADKALARSLTPEQRARIEASRQAALETRQSKSALAVAAV